jgi:polyhydroxyalkanoate synthesis repressor PhaR
MPAVLDRQTSDPSVYLYSSRTNNIFMQCIIFPLTCAVHKDIGATMSKLRRIKKYKNRLMYDTVTSKLITLKQLAEMLKEDCNIRIEDNESGKDVTRMTILQMLIDLEKSGRGMRNLLPDLVASLFNLPRLDLLKVLKEMVQKNKHDKELGRVWAKQLIHRTSLASLIPLNREKRIVEEIAKELDDLYDTILEKLEQAVKDRRSAFDSLFNSGTDTAPETSPERERK